MIYYVPKIHENQEKPPGRPIISGIDSLFSRLGEYLDTFLQPLVPEGKSYLKDSKQLILELKNMEVTDEDFPVTIDVNSLYTNIVQEDSINSAEPNPNTVKTSPNQLYFRRPKDGDEP